jgi:asparaginyl-tRNA synthetase
MKSKEVNTLKSKQSTQQKSSALIAIPKPLEQLSESEIERKSCISKVMTCTLKNLTSTFITNGFHWLLPVTLSRSTDPLWPDPGASIEKRVEVEIYGKTVRTTASMIIHKLIASSLAYPKLFILSPNIRIEKADRACTGLHVYEFTQLDFEVRNATSKDIISLVEDALCELISSLKRDMKDELTCLGRYDILKVPKKTFKTYDRQDLEAKYGADWERHLFEKTNDPVWVTNIPREFYDFEDFKTGKWDNYDLFLPKYGEVLSGAKREWEYKKIIKKMERDKINKGQYELILTLAKQGKLKPCAGAGIGMERLVGWITGAKHIGETQPFPKIPGTVYEL